MHHVMRIGVFVVLLTVAGAAAEPTYHTWSSTSGHSVKAAFERAESKKETSDTILVLRKEDGQVVQIPVGALTAESRRQALDQIAKWRGAQRGQPDKNSTPAESSSELKPRADQPAAAPPAAAAKSELRLNVGRNVQIRPPYSGSGESDILYAAARGPFVLLLGHVFDLRSNQLIGSLGGQTTGSRPFALSPDGRIILISNNNATSVQKLEADGKSAKQPYFFPERFKGGSTQFLDAETLLWTGSVKGLQGPHCLAFNASTGEELWNHPIEGLQSSNGSWNCLACKQKQIAFVDDKRIVWQELLTGKEITSFSLDWNPWTMQFSWDAQELAVVIVKGLEWRFLVYNARGEKVFDRPLSPANSQARMPIRWLPNGQGWLLAGTQLLDRRTGAIVWELRTRMTDHNAVVDDGHILTLMESPSNRYERCYGLLPIPWKEIEPAVQVATTKGRAAFAPGMKVKIQFQIAPDGIENPEAVRETLEPQFAMRLNYHGVDLEADAPLTVQVDYAEKPAVFKNPSRVAEVTKMFVGGPPRDALCTMRIVTATGKELWSQSYGLRAEDMVSHKFELEAWRKNALEVIASNIRGGQLPVIPQAGQPTLLPVQSSHNGLRLPGN
jgi:hypothetical protein